MKKTITILLLTALCMTVLTSCDLGNGLVAELFGDLNRQDIMVDPIPPVQNWETVYVEDMPANTYPWQGETTPPYEIMTEDYTIEEYWSEDIVPIEPVPDVEYQLDLVMDGDLSDWHDGICAPKQFGKDNLEAWVGEVGEQDGFTLRVAADATYVYFAVEVSDSDLVYSDDGTYNGDTFQMAIDFNCAIGATEVFERAIFYSFGLQQDGTVDMTVQCIHNDAVALDDYHMASDDDPAGREGEVIGVACMNDSCTGWIAEFAISIETLYRDVVWKMESAQEPVPEFDLMEYFKMQMLICYIDYATLQEIECAYGTPKKIGSMKNGEGWYPDYAGVMAYLYPLEGRGQIEYAWN